MQHREKVLSDKVSDQQSPSFNTITKGNQEVNCRIQGWVHIQPRLVAAKNHYFLMVFLTVFHKRVEE